MVGLYLLVAADLDFPLRKLAFWPLSLKLLKLLGVAVFELKVWLLAVR